MDKVTRDKYLNVLYLKSKDNLRKGYNEKLIAKLIGIDKVTSQNILHYLTGKKLIDTINGYGDNVILTPEGIDYLQELRDGKTFKIIRFKEAQYIPPTSKMVYGFIYLYSVINEDKTTEDKSISVFASDILSMTWQLSFYERPLDAEKILLQFAKDKVIEKLIEGTLNNHEEVILLTSTHPQTCPYNSENLIETKFAEYEVETSQKLLMEEISENKLAASIIEKRDIINALFSSRHGDKLLLLDQERNLLDFFKAARTGEEYSHRIASLGQTARNINASVLRNILNESDRQTGSIVLLERYLISINRGNKEITEILKHIGYIRKGYPIHGDNIGDVSKGYKYFKLKYPVDDFQTTWGTLLNQYLLALTLLYEIFVSSFSD